MPSLASATTLVEDARETNRQSVSVSHGVLGAGLKSSPQWVGRAPSHQLLNFGRIRFLVIWGQMGTKALRTASVSDGLVLTSGGNFAREAGQV